MKRITILIVLAITTVLPIFADTEKMRVAVFDPTSSGTTIDEGTKVAVREIISSTFVNSGNYDIVERSLLEKVMQEQKFSNSGAVNDNDATEIGKLAGANKVVLSVVTLTSGRNMLSIKMIDVKTASVERQKVKVVASRELLGVVEPTTLALIDTSAHNNDDTTEIATSNDIIEENEISNNKKPQRKVKTTSTISKSQEAPRPKITVKDNEFVLSLPPQQIENELHKDNYIRIELDGKTVGGGTLSKGFEIIIKEEKKHRKYTLKIYPTSVSDKGKTDEKIGMTKYEIDTSQQQYIGFMLQTRYKGDWTIYSALRL